MSSTECLRLCKRHSPIRIPQLYSATIFPLTKVLDFSHKRERQIVEVALNGILIGVAKNRGIEGVCLMGEIRYANVPQHMSSKAVLEKLADILGLEIDTAPLERRARKIDASIRKSLGEYDEYGEPIKKEEKAFRYIS